MQPYSYRDSGIEWLGKIPTHWKVKRLKSFGEGTLTNGLFKKKDQFGSGVKLINVSDLYQKSNVINFDHLDRVMCSDEEIDRYRVRAGDIFFVRSSLKLEGIGVSAVFTGSEEETVFECHIIRFRPDMEICDPRFLTYQLNSKAVQGNFVAASRTVTMTTISQDKIASIHLARPPLAEQRAIAGFLDEACGKIDAAIQVKREQVAMLDVMAKAILNKAVLEGLNPAVPKQTINNIWFKTLPAHWQLRRLKDVSTMQTGVTLGKDYDGETDERPYLRLANVQDGHLALDDVKTIKLPPHLVRRYELQDGDVLMNEGGDLDKLGRGHVWHNEIPGCLHQNHVFALRCFPHKLLPDYLTLLTSSIHGRAYFEIMGKKTTNLASINSTKVNLFPVPLPPVIEQAEIVQWVQHERGKLKQAQDAVNAQIAVLEAYKKSLVHECVTGKKQVWRGA